MFRGMLRPFFILLAVLALGCNAEIGDECAYDIDCSPDGDRTCDNNQPGGYCLIITCSPDQCPNEASCVEFITPSPDLEQENEDASALYAQLEPNRSRTYCLKRCRTDSQCRGSYHCAIGEELEVELNAEIIDTKYTDRGICVPNLASHEEYFDTADTGSDT